MKVAEEPNSKSMPRTLKSRPASSDRCLNNCEAGMRSEHQPAAGCGKGRADEGVPPRAPCASRQMTRWRYRTQTARDAAMGAATSSLPAVCPRGRRQGREDGGWVRFDHDDVPPPASCRCSVAVVCLSRRPAHCQQAPTAITNKENAAARRHIFSRPSGRSSQNCSAIQ